MADSIGAPGLTDPGPPSFGLLYRLGAYAALTTVAVTVVQIVLGVVAPPPDFAPTVEATTSILSMAQSAPLLTFLQLDGLMIFDYVLLIVVYVALFAALRRESPSLTWLGTGLALVALALYFTTNPAATMLVLAQHYDPSASAAASAGIVAAGQAALLNFQGTAFLVHYIAAGIAGMLVSAAMLNGAVFTRATAIAGLLQGAMMLVPVTFGTVGLVFAVGSLVPFLVWFVLVALRLLRLSAAETLA